MSNETNCNWPGCTKPATTEIEPRLVLKEYQVVVATAGNRLCPDHVAMVFCERPL